MKTIRKSKDLKNELRLSASCPGFNPAGADGTASVGEWVTAEF
jgi:hypothetical protein